MIDESKFTKINTKAVKREKRKVDYKNLLLKFFVVEHIVFALLIFFTAFSYVRASTFSPFADLDSKARSFQPINKDDIYDDLENQLMNQMKSYANQNEFVFADMWLDLFVDENYINTFFSELELSNLEQIYLDLEADNSVLIWILIEDLDYPLMAKYEFEIGENYLKLKPQNLQLSFIPLPIKWTNFFDVRIEEAISEALTNFQTANGIHLVSLNTTNEGVFVEVLVDDMTQTIKNLPK